MNKNLIVKEIPCTVICHGASEVELIRFIKAAYRLPIKIYSKQNGKQNIELTSLKEILSRDYLKSEKDYLNFLGLESIDFSKHKIFILLDQDGHIKESEEFLDKSMFKKHWAKDIIEPLLSIPNLDEIFFKNSKDFNKNHNKPGQYAKALNLHKNDFREYLKSVDKNEENIYKIIRYLDSL